MSRKPHDIEESEKICNAATPGPMYAEEEDWLDFGPEGLRVEPCVQIEDQAGKRRTVATIDTGGGIYEDAVLFAHSRTAFPEVLAELKAARAEIERLREALGKYGFTEVEGGDYRVGGSYCSACDADITSSEHQDGCEISEALAAAPGGQQC